MVFRRRRKMAAKPKAKCSGIEQNELFSKIQKRAYELYKKRGFTHGSDWTDWFEAEQQVKKDLL